MNQSFLKVFIAASMLLVVGTGCFRHAYKVGTGAEADGTPNYTAWQHNLLWGLIGGEDVDVKKICPSGNAYIQNYFSVVDSILSAVVGGIWSPTTVEVYCDNGSRSDKNVAPKKIELSASTVRRIGNDARFLELAEAYAPARVQAVRTAQISTSANALSCR